MGFKSISLAVITLIVSSSVNAATILTVEGNEAANTSNCIPFGCTETAVPHAGFVYQNIDAFTLNAGDIIAFDLSDANDEPLNFAISLAQTEVNGGYTANSNGFTTIVSNGFGSGQGNNVIGDYDLQFTLDSAFVFSGGGLIIDLVALGDTVTDTVGNYNLVSSDPSDSSGLFVGRYFSSDIAGPDSINPVRVANFQLISAVPVPAAVWLFGSGLLGLVGIAKRKKA